MGFCFTIFLMTLVKIKFKLDYFFISFVFIYLLQRRSYNFLISVCIFFVLKESLVSDSSLWSAIPLKLLYHLLGFVCERLLVMIYNRFPKFNFLEFGFGQVFLLRFLFLLVVLC